MTMNLIETITFITHHVDTTGVTFRSQRKTLILDTFRADDEPVMVSGVISPGRIAIYFNTHEDDITPDTTPDVNIYSTLPYHETGDLHADIEAFFNATNHVISYIGPITPAAMRKIRLALDIPQWELGARMGYTVNAGVCSYISTMETGRRPLSITAVIQLHRLRQEAGQHAC